MAILDLGKFDPTSASAGNFKNLLAGGVGTLVIVNDSSVTIKLKWGNRTKRFIAGTIDVLKLCEATPSLDWMQDVILGNASQAPVSIVLVDGYSPEEELPYSSYPIAIPRTSNIGNQVNVSSSTTSVVNDGNPTPTQVVEATPMGSGSSSLLFNNDGSGKFGGGLIVVSASGIFTSMPSAAIPAASVGAYGAGAIPATAIGAYGAGTFPTSALGTFSAGAIPASALGNFAAALIDSIAAGSVSDTVLLDIARTGSFGVGHFQIGIDTNGRLYINDVTNGGKVLTNVAYGTSLMATHRGSGGTAGPTIWEGTTDPGGSAVEGDIWVNG